jgi:hypothetical protein
MRQSWRRIGASIMVVALVGVGSVRVAATSPRQQRAVVTLVHGVRGLVADIYIDGEVALKVFEPERLTDPLPMEAGEHLVEVRRTGEAPTTAPLLSKSITVPASGRFSAAVHLAADGSPTLTVFQDDGPPIPPGEARAVVRHTAAAAPIDVSSGDRQIATGMANGSQASSDLPAGDPSISVTSGGQPIIPTQQMPLTAGTERIFYLIGSSSESNLVWLTQTVEGLGTGPTSVNTGSGGLAAPSAFPTVAIGALTVVVLAAASRLRRPSRFWR